MPLNQCTECSEWTGIPPGSALPAPVQHDKYALEGTQSNFESVGWGFESLRARWSRRGVLRENAPFPALLAPTTLVGAHLSGAVPVQTPGILIVTIDCMDSSSFIFLARMNARTHNTTPWEAHHRLPDE